MLHDSTVIHVRDGKIARAFEPSRSVTVVATAATGVAVVVVTGANEEKSRGSSAADFEQYLLGFVSAQTSVIP